ncbi:hypothetical protein [Candidatus Villigracilis vicinus]|jgi:hypothetical protein
MTNPYKKISMKPQAYQWLRFGEIKPTGWILSNGLSFLIMGRKF